MKKSLLASFVFLCALGGYSEPIPADDILAFVRTKLPSDPLKLTGTLKVRTKKGFTQTSLPVEMELDWGATVPTAAYRIGGQTLDITWKEGQPSYAFSKEGTLPTDQIIGTGLTWTDLSFSVLWWPNSTLIDEATKINRECYVIDVPVPDSKNTMRLWIEKKMGMLLESQTLDARKKEIRRMKIKSIKKMDGMWVAKDLEIRDKASGNKTTLQTTDLIWKNPKPTPVAFDPTDSVNQLAIDLYQKLAAEENGNLFLSPYSISTALAMTYGGARGETAEQMNSTLHFGGQGATHPAFSHLRKKLNGIQEKGHVQLSVANKLWPQKDYTFLPDYLALTKEFYGSEIQSVDYKTDTEGARKKINDWVEKQTNNKIKDLIGGDILDDLTRLVLVNAIYFKGDWETEFDPRLTYDNPFHISDTQRVIVPTMGTFEGLYTENESFQVLELPYKEEDLSMLILLPQSTNGLSELDQAITPETIAALNPMTNDNMIVRIPKFAIGSSIDLRSVLSGPGMTLPFSENADFSGITDGPLQLDSVIHKTSVTVTEKGTEAVAATTVGVAYGGGPSSPPTKFIADHPFLFLIRENSTGTILFIGRVTDPTK